MSVISIGATVVCSFVLLPDNLAENFFDSVTASGLAMEVTEKPFSENTYTQNQIKNESSFYDISELYDEAYSASLLNNSSNAEELSSSELQQPTDNTENSFGLKVTELDMSLGQTSQNILLKNESNYQPDIYSLMDNGYPISYSDDGPLVLIIHTHGTECYLPSGNEYTASSPTHSEDPDAGVVSVGRVFSEALTKKGISVIHCETMFDKDSYSHAYDNSEKAIIEYIELYPTIKYIFDIHRDSFSSSDGSLSKAVGYIDSVPYAQVMFVVGTDSLGANHPNWQKNLTVASFFQKAMLEKYDCIMRQINLRGASFNAEHAIGSVLIEIGSCGNTIDEAKNSAEILGETIGDIILAG